MGSSPIHTPLCHYCVTWYTEKQSYVLISLVCTQKWGKMTPAIFRHRKKFPDGNINIMSNGGGLIPVSENGSSGRPQGHLNCLRVMIDEGVKKKWLVRATAHYCASGHFYHKPTHLWTNMKGLAPRGTTGTVLCGGVWGMLHHVHCVSNVCILVIEGRARLRARGFSRRWCAQVRASAQR